MSHPAKFSVPILDLVGDILVEEYPSWLGRPYIFDAFAGTGERLRDLAERIDFGYAGVEIEASFIAATGIKHGNACEPQWYPDRWENPVPYLIFTSPVYPQGTADHAVANDASKRYTYRKAISTIEGADRELHAENAGRWGFRGSTRGGNSVKRAAYWDISNRAVKNWGRAELVIVNVSDFIHTIKGEKLVEPVVEDWKALLEKHGWTGQTDHPVGTPRMRNGENAEVRVAHEVVVVARRD